MEIEFTLNGEKVCCPQGLTLAGALFYLGKRVTRRTPVKGESRSVFCGMGVCFDCVMRVDGRDNVPACQTEVLPGMVAEIQSGEAALGEAN